MVRASTKTTKLNINYEQLQLLTTTYFADTSSGYWLDKAVQAATHKQHTAARIHLALPVTPQVNMNKVTAKRSRPNLYAVVVRWLWHSLVK